MDRGLQLDEDNEDDEVFLPLLLDDEVFLPLLLALLLPSLLFLPLSFALLLSLLLSLLCSPYSPFSACSSLLWLLFLAFLLIFLVLFFLLSFLLLQQRSRGGENRSEQVRAAESRSEQRGQGGRGGEGRGRRRHAEGGSGSGRQEATDIKSNNPHLAKLLRNVLRATTAFSASQLPKVVRTLGVLYILTWKCAPHNGVHIATSKSGLVLVCFVHFDLEMCFAPQRRALFRHRNFQEWSGAEVFCTV